MRWGNSTEQVSLFMIAIMTAAIFAMPGPASGQQMRPEKSGIEQKLSTNLIDLKQEYEQYLARPVKTEKMVLKSVGPAIVADTEYVVIDALPMSSTAVLQNQLQAIGAINIVSYRSVVSARVPLGAIGQLAQLSELRFAQPYMAITWAGATTSQGDVSQRSDVARNTRGISGSGVTVGVLSNSYACTATPGATAADDVASGDLPIGVINLLDFCQNSDEGRAMLQIVHDVAPGAALAFHTALGGQAVFATGIDALVTAGADVIVDDVFYFGEPMFQDGNVAQAADAAVAAGVAYFSAAGNSADGSYESTFRNSGVAGPNLGLLHDFDPGPGTVTAQPITIPVGTTMTLVLQWNQPFFAVSAAPGASSDVEVYLMAADGTSRLTQSRNANIGADPVEAFSFSNSGALPQGANTRFFLQIENFRGPDPDVIKYMYVDGGGGVTVDQFATFSGTAYGHSAAAGASSVGAANYGETPAFGVSPPRIEPFSSFGDVPIFFDTAGTPINPPELRLKPQIVAPDRINNTFFGNDTDGDGFPNFGGTSAAAPHAAGAAALLLEFDNTLTPAQIYAALEDSTIEMEAAGFDFVSGHGLIQIDSAIDVLANPAPALTSISGRFVAANDTVNIPLTATDPGGGNVVLSTPVLPAFCSLTDNGNGTGNVGCSPTPSDVGRHALVVSVADVGIPPRSNSQGFYVVVSGGAVTNNPPVLTFIGNQSVNEGQTLALPLSATDPDGNALTISSTGLPAFCSLSDNLDGSGNITCNPGVGDAGTYPLTITVTDNGTPNLNDSELINIVVGGANQSPVLTFIGNQSANEGQTLDLPLSATDPDGNALTISSTGLPAFCSLSDNLDGSGNITCNPGAGDAGTYPLTVTVTDNGTPNLNDSELISIIVNVAPRNEKPRIAGMGSQEISAGATLIQSLSATDKDGNNLTFSATGLPLFCTLTDNGDGSGSITCGPGAADAGSYQITVAVTDDGIPNLSDSRPFNLSVINSNQAPLLAAIGNQTVAENSNLVIPLSATDAEGGSLVFTSTGLPVFCSLSDNGAGSGSISCNPISGSAGSYPVTVTVTDNGTPNQSIGENFSILVTASGNQAPILAAIGSQNVNEGVNLVIQLTATDAEGDSLAFSTTGLPSFCTLSDGGAGSGSINCNPLTGNAGSYPVSVTVADNGTPALNDSEAFDIVVVSPSGNQAPVLTPIGDQNVNENAGLVIPLSASDPEADALIFSSTGLPPFCALSDNLDGTGSMSCNPQSGQAGTYSVTVSVTDNGIPALAGSEVFSIIVAVVSGNQAPVLAPIGSQIIAEGAVRVIALNASDANGDRLRFDQSGMPAFCTMIDNSDGTGTINCSPDFTAAGTYVVTITVQDNGGPQQSDAVTFDIVVNNVNAPPALVPVGDQSTKEARSLVIDLQATDVDGDNITFDAVGLPLFCGLADNTDGTAQISCNPVAGDLGTYPVTLTVTDNGIPSLSDGESFNIVVDPR